MAVFWAVVWLRLLLQGGATPAPETPPKSLPKRMQQQPAVLAVSAKSMPSASATSKSKAPPSAAEAKEASVVAKAAPVVAKAIPAVAKAAPAVAKEAPAVARADPAVAKPAPAVASSTSARVNLRLYNQRGHNTNLWKGVCANETCADT